MFEVLVFVYENYWRGDACPQWEQLGRKLSAVGFEQDEIQEALVWLNGLSLATRGSEQPVPAGFPQPDAPAAGLAPSASSMRVYSVDEQNRMGPQCLGFLHFLDAARVLPAHMREVVIERAMASNCAVLGLDDLKIIVLMVYWSYGQEPDALVLDELCDNPGERVAH